MPYRGQRRQARPGLTTGGDRDLGLLPNTEVEFVVEDGGAVLRALPHA